MKIAIVGAGRVGSTVAYSLLLHNLAQKLVLIDINKDRCEGEVLDLADVLPFCQTACIKGVTVDQARDSDIIIICAGQAQKPGQSRLELFDTNKKIIASLMRDLEPINPHALIIMVTNPLDLMTCVAQQHSSLSRNQIFGTGTWLDTQRLRRYLGAALDVSATSIEAFIIGEHGDSQCVAWSHALCGGSSLLDMCLTQEQLNVVAQQAKEVAYTIIEKKCATYYGIASCVTDICQAIIFDQKRVLPLSTYSKEFEVCLSLPVVLGRNGIERHLSLALNEQEKACLRASAHAIKKYLL